MSLFRAEVAEHAEIDENGIRFEDTGFGVTLKYVI